jgi:hypothetical protein
MRRHLAVALAWLAAVACSAAESATPAPSHTLTAEVLYIGLDTRPDSYAADRLLAAALELAASPDDVLCIAGAWAAAERATIVSALEGTFPYALELPTYEQTPVDDPEGVDGTVPEPETEPACGATQELALGGLISCMTSTCAVPFGDPNGQLFSLYCLVPPFGPCVDQIAALEVPADPKGRCRACVLNQIRTGATFEEISERCGSQPGDPLGFGGDSGLLVLSKHRIAAADLYVLPAAGLRRAALFATVVTPSARRVGVVCATLGPTASHALPADPDTAEPYVGPYGGSAEGWRIEHRLQLDKLLARVSAEAVDPILVMGSWGDSPGYERDGETIVTEADPESVARLGEAFAAGEAPGYAPACTLCPDNRLAPNETPPAWPNRIYLRGLPRENVRATVRTYLGNVVEVEPSPASGFTIARVPLSVVYGLRSEIALDP